MIYTLTLNPSLDYLVEMEKLMPGKINRADSEEIFYGGKGVNVSIMLKHLNVDSIALGFTAGVTAELFENGVRSCGVTPSFLRVKNGFTRINVKILDEEETEVNGQGPQPDAEEIGTLMSMLDRLGEGDVLVMAGSVPKSVPDTIYAQIMKRLSGRGVLCIVDTSGSGHSALADFLKEKGAGVLICGGIGVGAVTALQNAGIQILGGAEGEADKCVEEFLGGRLHFGASGCASCSSCGHHHGDGDEEECDGNISACGTWCH